MEVGCVTPDTSRMSESQQSKGGKPRQARWIRCGCPKCREPLSKVLATKDWGDGVIVRHRACTACDHRWFTAQEPEYLVRGYWRSNKPALLVAERSHQGEGAALGHQLPLSSTQGVAAVDNKADGQETGADANAGASKKLGDNDHGMTQRTKPGPTHRQNALLSGPEIS